MKDPRTVKLSHPGPLTIVWTDPGGQVYQALVASMATAFQPIELHVLQSNSPAWGIYNQLGEEIWPSDCAALGRALDAAIRDEKPATTASKLGQAMGRATTRRPKRD